MDPLSRVFVVMPVANEEATIESLLREITSLLDDGATICPVMDKYSRDGTREIISKLEAEFPGKIQLLYFEGSTGAASCYLYGFKHALKNGATVILEMDAGWSHKPSEIPRVLEPLRNGYDCTFGSRFMAGGSIEEHPLRRRLLSRGGTVLANLILGTRLRDMTSGFEAFRAEVLELLDLDSFLSSGHMINTELRYYCRNFRVTEVPITYTGSTSALKMKMILDSLRILFQLRKHPNAAVSSVG